LFFAKFIELQKVFAVQLLGNKKQNSKNIKLYTKQTL